MDVLGPTHQNPVLDGQKTLQTVHCTQELLYRTETSLNGAEMAPERGQPDSTNLPKGGQKPNGLKTRKSLPNRAVYITGLPLDVTVDELQSLFAKCGILAEDDEGNVRIKLYTDSKGVNKGDALIHFFRPESVELACSLYNEYELRFGEADSVIKVEPAVFDNEKKEVDKKVDEETNNGSKDKKRSRLASKLDWNSDSENETDNKNGKKKQKPNLFVILKNMFTLEELKKDPTLLLDLTEDVRDECSKLGNVTNVQLYDLEKEGIMMIRYSDELSAKACEKLMHDRYFDGKKIQAYCVNYKPRFKKSDNSQIDEDKGVDDNIKSYDDWLENSQ